MQIKISWFVDQIRPSSTQEPKFSWQGIGKRTVVAGESVPAGSSFRSKTSWADRPCAVIRRPRRNMAIYVAVVSSLIAATSRIAAEYALVVQQYRIQSEWAHLLYTSVLPATRLSLVACKPCALPFSPPMATWA